MKAWIVAWVFFASGIYFGAFGALGVTYSEDDPSYRVYQGAVAGVVLLTLLNRLLSSKATSRPPTRSEVVYGALIYVMVLSIVISLLRFGDSATMHRVLLLFVVFTVPAMLMAFLGREEISRLSRPLVVVSAATTMLMAVARLRGATNVVVNGSTESYYNNVGGASHLTIGAAMSLAVVIHFVAFLNAKPLLVRCGHGAVALVALALILDSGSRGATLAVAGGLFSIVLCTRGRRSVGLLLLSGVGVLGVRLLSSERSSLGIQKILSLGDTGSFASDGRVGLQETAWRDISENPLIGGGIGSFSESVGFYAYPHNLMLEVLNDFGVVGGVALLVLLLAGAPLIPRAFNAAPANQMIAAILVTVLIQFMFSGSYVVAPVLWLATGLLVMRGAPANDAGVVRRHRGTKPPRGTVNWPSTAARRTGRESILLQKLETRPNHVRAAPRRDLRGLRLRSQRGLLSRPDQLMGCAFPWTKVTLSPSTLTAW